MKRLKSADLPQLREHLTSATVVDRGLTTLEAVIEVLPLLDSLRAKGASFNEIAEILRSGGLTLCASTLRQYYRRGKESLALSARVRGSSDPAHKGRRETGGAGAAPVARVTEDSLPGSAAAPPQLRPTKAQRSSRPQPAAQLHSNTEAEAASVESEREQATGPSQGQTIAPAAHGPVSRPAWMPASQINVIPDRKSTVG